MPGYVLRPVWQCRKFVVCKVKLCWQFSLKKVILAVWTKKKVISIENICTYITNSH
jgi:hypothetical protein